MHTKSTPSHVAGQPPTDLVLERLPNGELAWLQPATDRRYVIPHRFVLTDAGRRAIAMEACFGRPWPTVAEHQGTGA